MQATCGLGCALLVATSLCSPPTHPPTTHPPRRPAACTLVPMPAATMTPTHSHLFHARPAAEPRARPAAPEVWPVCAQRDGDGGEQPESHDESRPACLPCAQPMFAQSGAHVRLQCFCFMSACVPALSCPTTALPAPPRVNSTDSILHWSRFCELLRRSHEGQLRP